MKKLHFELQIHASAQKIWQILWDQVTYKKWTSPFMEGSYAVSDWIEGSTIKFLSPDGGGLYGIIEECRPNEYMAFKHLGEIKNFEELPIDTSPETWSGSMETYSLKEEQGGVLLECTLDANDQFEEFFSSLFPKAMEIVKELAENPFMITIEATVEKPVGKVWEYFTGTEHITKWNAASDDWHTPHAVNDFNPGGRFFYRMEAKDGSFGFDFSGKYDLIKTNESIFYTLDDGRKVNLAFVSNGKSTKVIESFEAENENSIELQQTGWQMILNNFKKYCESHSK